MKTDIGNRHRVSAAFMAGMSFSLCVFAFIQDFIGKERFIAYLQEYWISSGFVTLFIAVLGAFNLLSFLAVRHGATRSDFGIE